MRTIQIFIYCFISFMFLGYSQTNDINDIQYGVAIKATIDFNGFANSFKYTNYNIAVVGGAGAHPFDYTDAYPSIHAGLLLYNRGDLISSYEKGFLNSTTIDFILDFSVTVGYYTGNVNFDKRFVPLYHFSDFTPNPLQNPFQHSLTVGTNFIWFIDKYKRDTKELPQRVGFTGIMIDRRFQLNTYNDGSIWAKIGLTDRLDRYYTGGGVIAYHINNQHSFNNIELSFHKFTGHEKYAFDTANLLQLDFIPFKNPKTYYYSKSRFRVSLTSFRNNFGLHVTLHNTDSDPQDYIHFTGQSAYHPDIFPNKGKFWNDLKRLGLGGFWLNTNSNFTN
ncbi:hypothetical protein IMCC3317_40900 [Kordia antarctica]|uniref:Uncharacterized protein n=1 Tax=Kordia antarctica TaxID=1218801 RepID=A0A7L4ZR71_9FLAO|nr:hypothetical protein [Kordia antarctica]QHI38696.1 hypothetical protein IMCC3317_40900 [Kordia antarctica]